MLNQIIKWLLVVILVVFTIWLIGLSLQSYTAEVYGQRALPMSIVVGLTAIAVAINQKKC